MKCFNHVDREAVGQCKSCGKGLCKDCFQQNGGMCNECVHNANSANFEENYNQLLNDLTHYRSKLYIKLFGGLILGVIIAVAVFMLRKDISFQEYWPFFIIIVLAPVGFFAMNFNKGGDPNKGYNDNIYTIETEYGYVSYQSRGIFMNVVMLAWFLFKSMIAMMLGPICFLYLVIKIVITSKHIKKLTKAYVELQHEEDEELKEKQAELEGQSENYSEPAPTEPVAPAEPAAPAVAPAPVPAEPAPVAPTPAPEAPAPAPAPETPAAPAAPVQPTPPAPEAPAPAPETPIAPAPTTPPTTPPESPTPTEPQPPTTA